MSTIRGRHINWTPEMDATIRSMWHDNAFSTIAAVLGCADNTVAKRGVKYLGLPSRKRRECARPDKAILIAAYRKHSGPAAPIKDILLGQIRKPVCIARWRAFQDVLTECPGTSVLGLAKVAGYDHTTILYGLNRLKEMEAA